MPTSDEQIKSFLEEDRKRDMPEDFWPDRLLVTGSYNGAELAFAITKETFLADRYQVEMKANIQALRQALWLAALDKMVT